MIDYDIHVQRPELKLKNMQLGFKLDWILWGIDMSISYYRGFDDMLQAERVYAGDIHLDEVPVGNTLEAIRMLL